MLLVPGGRIDQNISSVTVGGIAADQTLIVDDTGALIGTIIIPSVNLGKRTVIITGEISGPHSFLFTVNTSGWIILGTGFTAVITPTIANPTGWVQLTKPALNMGFNAAVTFTTANPTGWVQLTNPALNMGFNAAVTFTTANPTGWVQLTNSAVDMGYNIDVTAMIANPTGSDRHRT